MFQHGMSLLIPCFFFFPLINLKRSPMKTLFHAYTALFLAVTFFSCEETVINPQVVLIKPQIIGTGDVSDTSIFRESPLVIEIIDTINPVRERVFDDKRFVLMAGNRHLRVHSLQQGGRDELLPLNNGIMIWRDENNYCIRYK
jgi:hypothetical protein